MLRPVSRRELILTAPAGLTLAAIASRAVRAGGDAAPASEHPHFPHTDVEAARKVVGLAHSKLDELRPLVEERPTLALATVDWGFGDWETAIGAASHTGQRAIVEFLMSHGARPDIFTFAMLGHLAAVKSMIETVPGVQRTRGPHGITLLAHARAGGDASKPVLDYLQSLGDADPKYVDKPITDEEKQLLRGEYTFGAGPNDRLSVGDAMGALSIVRVGGIVRRLFHQGDLEFHPAGAPNVIVRFTMTDDHVERVTVIDGTTEIVAVR